MRTNIRIASLIGSISLVASAPAAIAQESPADAPQTAADVHETQQVVVGGLQINIGDRYSNRDRQIYFPISKKF